MTIREPHYLSSAWLALSCLAIIGTVLNTWVLVIFIKERKALISSVNAMTWYDANLGSPDPEIQQSYLPA